MSADFAGRAALVTGGSRGVGRAVALMLAARGADVAFIYRARDDDAEAVAAAIRAAGRRAVPLRADMADAAQVAAAVDRAAAELGRLDLVAGCAGVMVSWAETAALAIEEWDRAIAVDLSGTFYLLRAALPHLRAEAAARPAQGAAICCISSIAAQMCQARNAQGAAAKAGLEALVRVVAKEEGRRGVRANAVAIGLTDTEMGQAAFKEWGPETAARVVKGIPLRRIGSAEEVAKAVCFLLSPDAGYITGKVLQVDGGQIIAA